MTDNTYVPGNGTCAAYVVALLHSLPIGTELDTNSIAEAIDSSIPNVIGCNTAVSAGYIVREASITSFSETDPWVDALKDVGHAVLSSPLTPHAPAQSALDELRREVERLTKERDGLNDARNAAIERQNFMHTMTREAQEIAATANEHAAAARREVEALRADRDRLTRELEAAISAHAAVQRAGFRFRDRVVSARRRMAILRSALEEVCVVLQTNNTAIVDTVWVSSGQPETLLDRCLAAIDTARASTDEGVGK